MLTAVATEARLLAAVLLRYGRTCHHIERVSLVYLSHSQRTVVLEYLQRSALLVAPPVDIDEVLELVASVVDKTLRVLAQKALHIEVVAVVGTHARHIVDTERLCRAIEGAVVPLDVAALDIENLETCFFTDNGVVRSVNNISFEVPKDSIVGLVGESGCGKSTLAKLLCGIYRFRIFI